MPARGGMAELNDAEVKRAVEFMMNSGAAGAVVAAAAPAAAAPAAPAAVDGKKVYDTACTACHAAGIAGAPKHGDKAAWAPRIAQGANVLYDHAIKGFQGKAGVMPAKGGNTSLSDADVKAAVDYMVAGVEVVVARAARPAPGHPRATSAFNAFSRSEPVARSRAASSGGSGASAKRRSSCTSSAMKRDGIVSMRTPARLRVRQ